MCTHVSIKRFYIETNSVCSVCVCYDFLKMWFESVAVDDVAAAAAAAAFVDVFFLQFIFLFCVCVLRFVQLIVCVTFSTRNAPPNEPENEHK